MARLGVLSSEFECADLDGTLRAVTGQHVTAVQLQLGSAIAAVSLDAALREGLGVLGDHVTAELCEEVRARVAAAGCEIAAVDGTFNMVDLDGGRRAANLAHLQRLITFCSTLDTSIVTLCTGSRDPVMWHRHPDNDSAAAWADLVDVLGPAVATAEQHGVVLAFEPEINNVVSSAVRARRLLDEIGSASLQVVLDPANIFAVGELPRMRYQLEEAFDLLGPAIALAHCKDLDHDGDAGHLGAGQGRLDYPHYLSLLQASGFDGTAVLHQMRHLSAAGVSACFAFVREQAPAGYFDPAQ